MVNKSNEKEGEKMRVRETAREREREHFSGSHPIPSTLRQLPNQTCQLPLEGQSVKVESQYNAVCTLSVAAINDPIQTLSKTAGKLTKKTETFRGGKNNKHTVKLFHHR